MGVKKKKNQSNILIHTLSKSQAELWNLITKLVWLQTEICLPFLITLLLLTNFFSNSRRVNLNDQEL